MAKGLVAVAVMSAMACSFVFVDGPPDPLPPPPAPIACTTSRTAPVIDTVISAGAGVALLAAVLVPCNGELCGFGQLLLGVPAVAVGAVFIPSARVGYRRVRECRAARHAADDWTRVNNPRTGGEGHLCRRTGPPCDVPLTCVEDRCRAVPGTRDNACARPFPDLPGRCDPGLLCRDARCVPRP